MQSRIFLRLTERNRNELIVHRTRFTLSQQAMRARSGASLVRWITAVAVGSLGLLLQRLWPAVVPRAGESPARTMHPNTLRGRSDPPPAMPAERLVLDAVARGEIADFEAKYGPCDPEQRTRWGPERTIRGEFLSRLCGPTDHLKRTAHRGIRIKAARILGDVNLAGVELPANLVLHDCRVEGTISLRDASVRVLNLAGSEIGDLDADRIRSSGSIYLRHGFKARGFVRLSVARIDGDLDCTKASLQRENSGPDDFALRCDRMVVKGSVLLKDFRAEGTVRLRDARIETTLECSSAGFNGAGQALLAENLKVDGGVIWTRVTQARSGRISFANASAESLHLGAGRVPVQGSLELDGFQYSRLTGDSQLGAAHALRWLEAQPGLPYRAYPYEQLARVFRSMGLEGDARTVAIAKHRAKRSTLAQQVLRRERRLRHRSRDGLEWITNLLAEKLLGYGYRIRWAVVVMMSMVAFGGLAFQYAYDHQFMVPAEGSGDDPRRFNPIMYSADVFLPIVDFNQQSSWHVTGRDHLVELTTYRWTYDVGAEHFRLLEYTLIAFGWLLSTLVVASLAGVMKQD